MVPDSWMCTSYMEACTRLGHTDLALATYARMKAAPPGSPMCPSVHAYVAAMRAACEGGRWSKALDVWADLNGDGVRPTGVDFIRVDFVDCLSPQI